MTWLRKKEKRIREGGDDVAHFSRSSSILRLAYFLFLKNFEKCSILREFEFSQGEEEEEEEELNRENGGVLQMEEFRGERRSSREASPLRCYGDARTSLLRSQPEPSSGTYVN